MGKRNMRQGLSLSLLLKTCLNQLEEVLSWTSCGLMVKVTKEMPTWFKGKNDKITVSFFFQNTKGISSFTEHVYPHAINRGVKTGCF